MKLCIYLWFLLLRILQPEMKVQQNTFSSCKTHNSLPMKQNLLIQGLPISCSEETPQYLNRYNRWHITDVWKILNEPGFRYPPGCDGLKENDKHLALFKSEWSISVHLWPTVWLGMMAGWSVMCAWGPTWHTSKRVSGCVWGRWQWPPSACVLSIGTKTFSIAQLSGRGSWTCNFPVRLLVASLTRLSAPSFFAAWAQSVSWRGNRVGSLACLQGLFLTQKLN